MITKFVLNTLLTNVVLYWRIFANKTIKYDIKEDNHTNWLKKGQWYNTAICSKLRGTAFGDFIRNYRTDRYNIICSITTNDKQQPKYNDYVRIGGGRLIPKNATTSEL